MIESREWEEGHSLANCEQNEKILLDLFLNKLLTNFICFVCKFSINGVS